MAKRIRGQETFVQLVVDGNLLAGSFMKVENFKITPRADLVDSEFLGETEQDPDIIFHGYDFSFQIHEVDDSALDLWDNIVATLTAGGPQPRINVIVTKRFRDPGVRAKTQTLQNAVMKLDSEGYDKRSDYVKAAFSGKCRTKKSRTAAQT